MKNRTVRPWGIVCVHVQGLGGRGTSLLRIMGFFMRRREGVLR